MHMHSKLGDAYNKHYSGFVYHPEQFRMGANRLQYTDLSPSAACLDHIRMHDLIQERKDHRPECYIHSRQGTLREMISYPLWGSMMTIGKRFHEATVPCNIPLDV